MRRDYRHEDATWVRTQEGLSHRLGHAMRLRSRDSIVEAMASVPEGSVLPLGHDTWSLAGGLTVNRSVTLTGRGHDTVFAWEGQSGGPAVTISADDVTLESVRIKTSRSSSMAILVTGARCTLRNVEIVGFEGSIVVDAVADWMIEGCRVLLGTGTGINIRANSSNGIIIGNRIDTSRGAGIYGIFMADPVVFSGITGNNVADNEIRYYNNAGAYDNQAAGNVYGTLTVL